MKYDHYIIRQPKKWEHTWVYRPFVHERYNFPFLLKMAGYGQWLAGESYSRDPSTDFFVEYVSAGNVHLIQNKNEYLIQPGEVYFLRKGVSHCYSTGSANLVLKRFVQIDGSGIDHHLQTLGLWNQDHIRPQSDTERKETL